MRLRTLALMIAIGCSLTAGAEAKTKNAHSVAATAKRPKVKRVKSKGKRRKVKGRKVSSARKVKR